MAARNRKTAAFSTNAYAVDGVTGIAIAAIAIVLAVVVVVVLLPLMGLLLELILVLVLLASGIFGRVVLRRPWTIEAIDLDDAERSVAFAIQGFGPAGRAVEELAGAISAAGPPERLAGGERTVLPRPTF